jgi:uncharacterized Zn finger protein
MGTTANTLPACPRCGSRKRVIRAGDNEHTFGCLDCQQLWEDVDDGDVGRGRPETVAIRREEYALRQRDRRTRR